MPPDIIAGASGFYATLILPLKEGHQRATWGSSGSAAAGMDFLPPAAAVERAPACCMTGADDRSGRGGLLMYPASHGGRV
jgi:hypothetical protein